VKALLASKTWRTMSDREIAREAGVGYSLVAKLRKVVIQVPATGTSIATSKPTRTGKDGKRYPATRGSPALGVISPLRTRAWMSRRSRRRRARMAALELPEDKRLTLSAVL
jgi:hypothetical protein